ncbi:MAG TPA: GYF domain-containing protein, partial [Polyangiaceae bacterium]|nr:GYF domain-containing protein [Polyangiaceae bacterium]
MKFLCPSCKAKYQIADEKVSGRSVRMKCRKCGFVIPLSEIPPAPSTDPPSAGPGAVPVVPKAPLAAKVGADPVGPPQSPSAPGVGPGKPAPPRRPTLADVAFGAPKPPASPAAPGVRPAAPAAPGTPSAGIPAPPGRPAAPSVARPATKAPVPKSTATPGAKPASPAPATSAAAIVANAASSAAAVSLLPALDEEDDENDDSTHILKGGALADAFGALVGGVPSAGQSALVGMPADEWFVGINDVPVGPIRLGEIRKKAMLGAVTPESMVWRDGLEAWRPLKTFPELLAVLEESVSSVRAAAAPLLAPGADGLPAKSDADSFAAAGAAGGITGPAVVTDDFGIPGARPRSPVFAWLAVLVALAFGITIGFVMWSKQKPPETIVKYVEVPAKSPDAPAAAAVDPQAADVASPGASAAATKARPGGVSGSGKSTKASDAQPAGT